MRRKGGPHRSPRGASSRHSSRDTFRAPLKAGPVPKPVLAGGSALLTTHCKESRTRSAGGFSGLPDRKMQQTALNAVAGARRGATPFPLSQFEFELEFRIECPAVPNASNSNSNVHGIAVTTVFPGWIQPMAATLTQDRFGGPEWIFERKLDGIRVLAFKQASEVRLLSRNQLSQNGAYPMVAAAIASLPVREVILDGEATGAWGRQGDFVYNVFDIMWLDGRDLTSLPLDERRTLLRTLPLRDPVGCVEALTDERPWDRACAEGWEGVIAKRRDAPYEQKRSRHWLKMKCEASQELVVGGFTDPQGGRVGLGALLVGYYEGDDFVFAGKVGTGFDTKLLLDLREHLDGLEIGKPPFTRAKGLPRVRAHWVRPEIVVQVAFIEWTVHGKLRHSRLLGIRNDKHAREVTREAW